MEQVTKITVNFEARKEYYFGLLQRYILKTTVNNPVKINRGQYNCTILGDGKIQHFGTNLSTPPAQIYMRCHSIGQDEENRSQKTGNLNVVSQE